jgi:hypothetical protein
MEENACVYHPTGALCRRVTNTATGRKAPAPKSRSVADRWTASLAKDGWTPVSDCFLNGYSRLSPAIKASEAMFIIHLMSHKWDMAAPYPGFKSIARRMGLTPEGARLLARSLEKKGYLYRQMQVGQTNKFHLDSLFAALEKQRANDEMEATRAEQYDTMQMPLKTPVRRFAQPPKNLTSKGVKKLAPRS